MHTNDVLENQYIKIFLFKKQPPDAFCKKGVLKNFFTGKHLCWSLSLIKLQARVLKKRLQHSCFPVKFAKF